MNTQNDTVNMILFTVQKRTFYSYCHFAQLQFYSANVYRVISMLCYASMVYANRGTNTIFDQYLTISQKQCNTATLKAKLNSYVLYQIAPFPMTLS